MTIFILVPWFHPAYKAGGPIQSLAGMIKQLESGSVEFRVFCGNKDLDGTVLPVVNDAWVPHSAHAKVWYSADNNIMPLLKKEIEKMQPAALFILGLYDWNYNFKPLLQIKNVQKIISVRGMLHPGALSQKSFKKKIYLWVWKLLGLHKKNLFHVTDELEKEFVLNQFGPATNVKVANNFPLLIDYAKMPGKQPAELKLLSIALISPMKNHLLVLKALKEINHANISYDIYGPVKDEAYWKQCSGLIQQMPANIVVKYHGPVLPSAIEEILSQHHVFILPSKSENFGHSILEALSSGRPVITSNTTPWNDLRNSMAGINVDAEDIAAIKEAVLFFTNMGQNELANWSNGANAYAAKAVDIKLVKDQYMKLFVPNPEPQTV